MGSGWCPTLCARVFRIEFHVCLLRTQVIAKETCRALGMGTNILGVESLPDVDTSGYIPEDVGQRYGEVIERADGFAQVFPGERECVCVCLCVSVCVCECDGCACCVPRRCLSDTVAVHPVTMHVLCWLGLACIVRASVFCRLA